MKPNGFHPPFPFPSPLILDIPGVQASTWGGLPLFSSAQAEEATNASFALMSDVFMRGLQCHPPWGSCEVAAHVCGAIYSMMKWGDLCWFHIHLPSTHTCRYTHLVWACVPPTSTVLWLYVTANTGVHQISSSVITMIKVDWAIMQGFVIRGIC